MRVALAQLSVADGRLNDNLTKAARLLEWAIKSGAEAVFFPELAATGFNGAVELEELLALSNEAVIGIGAALKIDGKKYNAYILMKNGEVLYIRKKYVLFRPMKEHEVFEAGEMPEPVELGGLKFAFPICYELRFPELFGRLLGEVDVFVVPAAWPASRKDHWATLLQARSIETFSYVLGVNRWGPGTYGPFAGHSAVAMPSGEPLVLGEGEGLLIFDLEKELIEEWRKFPAMEDRIRLIGTLRAGGRRYGTS
ncbi:MAG: hypothetical protein GXO07_04075 [Crenarchaeota archaeon]|nr:hypothetical protein [Thermoproteota archaeon]